MPAKVRLFVKKRGQRRTGVRWYGSIGEAIVDATLVLIGVVGLYWLLDRVFLAEGTSHSWWQWSAVLIPIALVVYGAVDLSVWIWQNLASTERRAAAVQRATDWELPGVESKSGPLVLPTVPPVTAIVDSAGVKLRYRLPSDAASGQLSFALAGVCVVWNTLVIGFTVRALHDYLTGTADLRLTLLMAGLIVPMLLAGVWTVIALVRQILITTGTGTTLVEMAEHPLYAGRKYEAFVSQTGRLHARWFHVQLVCEERAMYQQGTDTRTATAVVHRETVLSERKIDIAPDAPLEAHFSFTLPTVAMHSFAAAHNSVSWALVVRGRISRWPEFERRFPLYVYPPSASS
jgi:cytochrome c oxidase subunit IV